MLSVASRDFYLSLSACITSIEVRACVATCLTPCAPWPERHSGWLGAEIKDALVETLGERVASRYHRAWLGAPDLAGALASAIEKQRTNISDVERMIYNPPRSNR